MTTPTVELTAYVDVYPSPGADSVSFNVWSSNVPPPTSTIEGAARYRLKFSVPDPRYPLAEVKGTTEIVETGGPATALADAGLLG